MKNTTQNITLHFDTSMFGRFGEIEQKKYELFAKDAEDNFNKLSYKEKLESFNHFKKFEGANDLANGIWFKKLYIPYNITKK
jgi:hypothetical protein